MKRWKIESEEDTCVPSVCENRHDRQTGGWGAGSREILHHQPAWLIVIVSVRGGVVLDPGVISTL